MRLFIFIIGFLLTGAPARAQVVISEIMYHPAGRSSADWEWVELHNAGSTPVALTGWCFDDDDRNPLTSFNIREGVIPPGGFVVLYNAVRHSRERFEAAWGGGSSGVTWIPVAPWPTLSNSSDRIALWDSFAKYGERDFTKAVIDIEYKDEPPWPEDDGAGSIYLKDLTADPTIGSNWALSQEGQAGAWRSAAVPGVGGGGGVRPIAYVIAALAIALVVGVIVWRKVKS